MNGDHDHGKGQWWQPLIGNPPRKAPRPKDLDEIGLAEHCIGDEKYGNRGMQRDEAAGHVAALRIIGVLKRAWEYPALLEQFMKDPRAYLGEAETGNSKQAVTDLLDQDPIKAYLGGLVPGIVERDAAASAVLELIQMAHVKVGADQHSHCK